MVLNLRVLFFALCSYINIFTGSPAPQLELGADLVCATGDTCTPVPECPLAHEAIISGKKHGLIRCGFAGFELDTAEIVCCPPFTPRLKSEKSKEACSNFHAKRQSRFAFNINGGTKAELGEFPHMAAIGLVDFLGVGVEHAAWDCGGSLISEKFVLTAAHCVENKQSGRIPLFVRLGMIDKLGRDNTQPQTFGIKNITIHQEYNSVKKLHDIALLELDKEVNITEYVLPACLYQQPDDPVTLTISGWGATTSDSGAPASDTLQKANINSINVTYCAEKYKNKMNTPITTKQICTFDENKIIDACQGDSGGPLQIIVPDTQLFEIVGITSFGLGCATWPGVYTRVYSYLDWIESRVWP